MREKDVSAKDYFENPARVADLLNVYMYEGRQAIRSEHVKEKSPDGFIPEQQGKKKDSIVITRDVVREVETEMSAVIIALETQSDIHYAMPLHIMGGNSAGYYRQWRDTSKRHKEKRNLRGAEYLSGFSKEDRLIPEAAIVLYFGQEPWNGPRCLKDMLDMEGLPESVQAFIADYPMNLLEIRRFPDYELFQTDLKWVFGFLQRDSDAESLRTYMEKHPEGFTGMAEDAYELINAYSHSKELEAKKDQYKTESGGINVCKAITDMIANSEKKGEERGIERVIRSFINLCCELGLSMESTISRIVNECMVSEEKAREYVEKYWVMS